MRGLRASATCAIRTYIVGRRALIKSVFADVTRDTDNLTRRFVELWANHRRDNDSSVERVFAVPVLAGHRLLNDDDTWRVCVITIGKIAPAQHRDFQNVEVRRRDISPMCKSMRWNIHGAANNRERERGSDFERQPGGDPRGNDI
jgi:hypothetical protein